MKDMFNKHKIAIILCSLFLLIAIDNTRADVQAGERIPIIRIDFLKSASSLSETEEVPEIEDETPEVEDENLEVEDETPEVEDETPEVEDETPEVEDENPEIEDENPEIEDENPEIEDENSEVEDENSEVEDENPEVDGETEETPQIEVCICESLCDAETPNLECPICGVEGAIVTDCCQASTPETEEEPEVEEDVVPETEEEPEVEEEEVPETEEEPEVEEEEVPEVEEEPEVEEVTPSTQITYNGKVYDADATIEISDEEIITIEKRISADNTGGLFEVNVPVGLVLDDVVNEVITETETETETETDEVLGVQAIRYDVPTAENSIKFYQVQSGKENIFTIKLKPDENILDYESQLGDTVVLVYGDDKTEIKFDLRAYIDYLIKNMTPEASSGDATFEVKTTYKNILQESAFEATNNDYILIEATLPYGHTGGTITFDIPVGFELVNAPGVSSVSSGNITSKDFLLSEGYIDATTSPSWTKNTIGSSNTNSGTLKYKLFADASKISIYVRLDTSLISYLTGDKQDIGQVTVSYDNCTDISTPMMSVDPNVYNLSFSSLSALEKIDSFLGTLTDATNTLVYGITDKINVTTSVSIDNNFIAAKTPNAQNLVVTINVPTGAVVTGNSGTVSTKIATTAELYKNDSSLSGTDTATYDTYEITISKPSFSLSSGKYTSSLANFITVQFPSDKFPLGTDDAKVSHYIYVHSFKVNLYEYDWSTKAYAYQTNITNDMDVRRTSIYIEKEEGVTKDAYATSWMSQSGPKEIHNPNDGKDQLLMSAEKYVRSTSGFSPYSDLPIVLGYYQKEIEENGVEQYLDNVSQIVMSVPVLGDIETYTTKIMKIEVEYEDGTDEVMDNFSGWYGDSTNGFYPKLNYSSSSGTFTGTNFTAAYICNTVANSSPTPAKITITAKNSKSISAVKVYLLGDNPTYNDNMFYVYGQPKSSQPTTNFSEHIFTNSIFEDSSFEDQIGNSAYSYYTGSSTATYYTNGFKWKEAVEFVLTRNSYFSVNFSNSSSDNAHYNMFNTARYNIKISMNKWAHNPKGYLDLGAIRYNNYTGSNAESVVLEIQPNGTALQHLPAANQHEVDIVKEIMFPYNNYSDITQIASVEYKYVEDDNVYVYNRDFHGTSNAPFKVEKRSVAGDEAFYANSSAFMTAPSDKSFEYITVTYDSWGVTSENRYVLFKGYPNEESVVKGTNGTATIHTVDVSYNGIKTTNTQKEDRTGRYFVDISPSGDGVGVDVLNTVYGSIPKHGDLGLVEYNTLVAGRTNTLQYNVYAGDSVYMGNSQGWRAIAFDIILPEGMTLNDARVSDSLTTMHSQSYYSSTLSAEKVGGITITNDGKPVETKTGYFENGDSTVDGNRYRITLDDPYTILYSFYGLSGNNTGLTQTCFTLSLDVFVESKDYPLLPYNKVFYAGSTAHPVAATSAGYSTGDAVTAGTSTGHDFGHNAITVGNGKNYYLYVDSFPFVSVHSANIEIDNTPYYYNASNSDTIGILDEEEKTASINYSITNAVTFDDVDDHGVKTAYVYFPLPINANNKSDLVNQQDFVVSLNGDITLTFDGKTITKPNETYSSTNGDDITTTVEWRYRNLPGQTSVINMIEAEKDWVDAATDTTSNANAMIVKIENFPTEGEAATINVSIPVKGPLLEEVLSGTQVGGNDTDDDGNDIPVVLDTVYGVGMAGISIFNTSGTGSTSIYFGGDGPDPSLMSVNPEYIGNNPVYFEFAYKHWDVDFKAMLSYGTIADGIVVTDFPQINYSNDKTEVYNKKTVTLPTPIEIDGYEFEGWYTDYDLKDTSAVTTGTTPTITADTTFYAKYSQKEYKVIYADYYTSYASLTFTPRTVSWDRPDLYSTDPTQVDGKAFLGWSTAKDDASKIISQTDSYATVATSIYGSGASSKDDITLYAVYDDTLYTIYYDIQGAEPLTNLKWDDVNLIRHSVSTTIIGKTLVGWGVKNDGTGTLIHDDNSDTVTMGEMYQEYYATYGIDNGSITLIPYYEDTKFTLSFDANGASGYTFTTDKKDLDNVSLGWSSKALELSPILKIDGKNFLGWSISETDSSICIDQYTLYSNISSSKGLSDIKTDPITLYAHFEDKEYTVIYDFNESTYAYAPSPVEQTGVKWGENVYNSNLFDVYSYDFTTEDTTKDGVPSGTFLKTATDEFKTMYRFEGWYTDSEYTNKVADIDNLLYQKTLVADDEVETVTLYAKYNIVHYAIFYGIGDKDKDGNDLSDTDIDYLANNVSFYERGRQEPDTHVIPQDGADIEFVEKGTEYFYTDPEVGFNVPGYEWNGWEAVETEVYDDDGDPIAPYIPVITDNIAKDNKYYKVYGYSIDGDGNYTRSDLGSPISQPTEEALTINGQFTPKYYYLSYLNSDGTEFDKKAVTWQGGDLWLDESLLKVEDGYQFEGWYTVPDPFDDETQTYEPITDLNVLAEFFEDKDDSGKLAVKSTIDGTPKLTLYAVFSPLSYPVYFDIGFVNQSVDYSYPGVSYVEIENQLSLPVIQRDGYSFNGWYADSELTIQVPYRNVTADSAWTFRSLYEAIFIENTGDSYDPDKDITIDVDATITLYASWSLNISLGITNQDVLFVIEDDSTIGQLEQSYSITNYSYDNIVGMQYISPANSEWDFVIQPILNDDGTLNQDYAQDDEEETLLDIIQAYADENDLTFDEAKQVFSELEIFEGLDIDQEIEDSIPENQMYIYFTGTAFHDDYPAEGIVFFENHLVGDYEDRAAIMKDVVSKADVIFQYKINREYEGGTVLDLFHIDYKFALE